MKCDVQAHCTCTAAAAAAVNDATVLVESYMLTLMWQDPSFQAVARRLKDN